MLCDVCAFLELTFEVYGAKPLDANNFYGCYGSRLSQGGKNSADLATRCHPQASAQKVVACWDPDWSEKHGVK